MVYGMQITNMKFIGHRYFNGKKYKLINDTQSEKIIKEDKKRLQEQGYSVRVIKYIFEKHQTRYQLYARKK